MPDEREVQTVRRGEPADSEVAKQIRDALRALNDALKIAAETGLTVQIDSSGHEVIGYPHLNRIYKATIERRTVVK